MSYQEEAVNKALLDIANLIYEQTPGIKYISLDGVREVLNKLYGARMARTEDDEYDEENYDLVSLDIADSMFGAQIGKGVLRTHSKAMCAGPPDKNGNPICCIHNPSDHHMLAWPQNWRDDKGMMERLCPHRIGHPDPDDLKVRTTRWAGVHGCDGCCSRTPKDGSTHSEG